MMKKTFAIINFCLVLLFFIFFVTTLFVDYPKYVEIIISSVSPRMHFLSKLVAANLFAIIQGLLIFAYGIIGCITTEQFISCISAQRNRYMFSGHFTYQISRNLGAVRKRFSKNVRKIGNYFSCIFF